MSITISNYKKWEEIYDLNKKDNLFPKYFNFSNNVNSLTNINNLNPNLLIIMINTSNYLFSQSEVSNKEQNQDNLKYLLNTIQKIFNENKSNKIYDDILIFAFNNDLHFITNVKSFSISTLEKVLYERSKQTGSYIIKAFDELLLFLDDRYNSYFNGKEMRFSK